MKKRNSSVSTSIGPKASSYSVDLSMRGVSFGIGPRSSILSEKGRDSPSPLNYRPTYIESPYKGVRLKGYSSDLNIIKRLQNRPGPGSYNPYEPLGANAPKITIKSRLQNKFIRNTPAPNCYSPEFQKVLRNSPIYSIPTGIRSKEIREKQQLTPGPGAYSLPKII